MEEEQCLLMFFNLQHFSGFPDKGPSLFLARDVQEVFKKLVGSTIIFNKHKLSELWSLTGKVCGSISNKPRDHFIC